MEKGHHQERPVLRREFVGQVNVLCILSVVGNGLYSEGHSLIVLVRFLWVNGTFAHQY